MLNTFIDTIVKVLVYFNAFSFTVFYAALGVTNKNISAIKDLKFNNRMVFI